MKFAATLSALAAFAATVVAQTADFNPINVPAANQEVQAGESFEVSWDVPEAYKDGTVSIHLIGGDSQGTQVPLADIAAGVPNADGKYTWDVDASLGDKKVYGLVFKWEADPSIFQYSMPFSIVAGEAEPTTDADQTMTVTTAYGTKTISISTMVEETTTSYTTSSSVVSVPASTPIVTPPVQHTTIVKKPSTSSTKPAETTVEEPEKVPTPAEPEPTNVPADSGASQFGASAAALVGALFVGAFAL